MSNHLSPSTKALLRAAKSDGPSREKRAAMWTGVTGGLVTHTPLAINVQGAAPQAAPSAPISATGTGATAAAKGGGLLAGASMKGAFIGALFGSAISIGVATFMLRSKPADPPAPLQTVVVTAPEKTTAPVSATTPNAQAPVATSTTNPSAAFELGATPIVGANTQSTRNSPGSTSSNASTSSSKSSSRSRGAAATTPKAPLSEEEINDMLSKETTLVAQAHRELLVGDAVGALKSIRAARSLEARQFEPQEMSIEGKALRALGRDAEAAKVEAQLQTSYPDPTLR